MHPAPSPHGQASRHVCPSCGGVIWSREPTLDRSGRCGACRAPLSEGGSVGEVRWLYPTPGEQVDGPQPTGPGTAVTIDLEGEHSGAPPPPRLDRYELVGELGRGGMGVVFRAWDPELQRWLALKVLASGAFASSAARARFVSEARAAAALDHPGIVRVVDLGAVDGTPYFTMELVRGPSIEDILSRAGPFEVREAVRIAAAVARAIAYAHAIGVAHRDIKPANILLDGDGRARVTDLGLARALDGDSGLTGTHQVLGTPAYLPGEVARSEPDLDWRLADQFGVGGVLYAMLTGEAPNRAANSALALQIAAAGERPSVQALRPDVPAALDAIVCKAMHPEPSRRYANVEALADDLDRLLAGEAVTARAEGRAERARRWLKRHRQGAWIAAAVALGLVATASAPRALAWRAEMAREAAADASFGTVARQIETATPKDGDALLKAFASARENAGTRAAALAWLQLGDRMMTRPRPRGDFDARSQAPVETWARSLTEAPDEATRGAALLRISEAAIREGYIERAEATVQALSALPTGTVDDARLATVAMQTALYGGAPERAQAAWARAVELGVADAYDDPARLDPLRADAELVLRGTIDYLRVTDLPDDPSVVFLDPKDLVEVALTDPPTERRRSQQPVSAIAQVVFSPGGVTLDPTRTGPHVDVDLDQDGVVEGYERQDRDLVRVEPDGRRSSADRFLTAAGSGINALVADDLDLDGAPELIVGTDGWRAYDLRVFGRGMRLRARAHRNATQAITTAADPWGPGRLVVSAEHMLYASAYAFGVDDPSGPPPALVVRRLVGDALVDVFTWVLPESVVPGPVLVGDVDGDGEDEILCGVDPNGGPIGDVTLVARPTDTPDHFAVSTIVGFAARGVLQLDDDPALEIVGVHLDAGPQRTRRDIERRAPPELWILGRGGAPAPPPARREEPVAIAASPTRPDNDGVMASARLLHAARLSDLAAAELRRAAERTADRGLAMASAELWSSISRPGDAALALELAAVSGAPGAWPGAVQGWLDAGDPAAALRTADAWRDADGVGASGPLQDTLDRWRAASQAKIEVGPGVPLHHAWQIERPLSLTFGETPQVHFVGTSSDLARLPLTPRGGPIALVVDTTVDRLEHLAMGAITLRAGNEHRGLKIEAVGAERAYFLRASCYRGAQAAEEQHAIPLSVPNQLRDPEPVRVRLTVSWTPEDRIWRCTVVLPDTGKAQSDTAGPADLPADMELVIADGYPDRYTPGYQMDASLDRITLWGFDAAAPSPAPRHAAALALQRGDPRAALALTPVDAPLLRAMALQQLRRTDDAAAALREAIDLRDTTTPFLGAAAAMLRAHRLTWAPVLRQAAGRRFPEVFWAVWDLPVYGNLASAEIAAALTDELYDLDWPDAPDHPTWQLYAAQALTWMEVGRRDDGLAAIARWLERQEAVSPPDRELDRLAARLLRARALDAAARGDVHAAQADVELAMQLTPEPHLFADRVVIEPAWGDLPRPALPPAPRP